MPLIKCPMCGKEISPNAMSCPNCGEPMKKSEDVKYSFFLEKAGYNKIVLLRLIREIKQCDLETAQTIIASVPTSLIDNIDLKYAEELKEKFSDAGATIKIVSDNDINDFTNNSDKLIRCPNCKSTKVKKIGGLSKAGSVALFGVFAMGKVSKTYECKNCGYRW